jgi:SAM-dependent methyltransferase
MASVREHYDGHLSAVYGWMVGDFTVAKDAARAELRSLGLSNGGGRVAVDLGAGTGVYAVALAEAGYGVTAIDTCAALLEELRANRGDSDIKGVNGDCLNWRRHCAGAVDVILCMGDTLTHLDSPETVVRLFEGIAEGLSPGGVFVATFRDYAALELKGSERFIPVRQDDRRMLTCFLEYRETAVEVYDLLHERTSAGWTLRVSSYAKLRLNPEWARSMLDRLGLVATRGAGPRGMIQIVATRP